MEEKMRAKKFKARTFNDEMGWENNNHLAFTFPFPEGMDRGHKSQ